jgi:transcriptional regulator GlxA family with amidase domain
MGEYITASLLLCYTFYATNSTFYEMSIYSPSEETLRITVLLLPESSMMVLASVIDPMRAANRLSERQCFTWRIVTTHGKPVDCTCGIQITADGMLDIDTTGDVLFVVSGFNQYNYIGMDEITLMRRIAPRFQALGGADTGAWILGKAGLLEEKNVTTHWEDLEDFTTSFRRSNVQPDRFVIDQPVFTIGGASPTFDFMLHLIRARLGYPLALEVASVFVYDETHFSTDAQPLVSLGLLNDFEPRVTRAIRIMESHIDEPISIVGVAEQLAMSSRRLEKLFQQHLQCSPGAYYLRLRLQRARKYVTDTLLTMQEIAIRTGFNSLSAFSRSYKKHYQSAPSDYRAEATKRQVS